jgi:hypothetical protein
VISRQTKEVAPYSATIWVGDRRQRGWDFGVAVDVMIVGGDLKFKPFVLLIVAQRH